MPSLPRTGDLIHSVTLALAFWLAGNVFAVLAERTVFAEGDNSSSEASSTAAHSPAELVVPPPLLADPVTQSSPDRKSPAEEELFAPDPVVPDPSEFNEFMPAVPQLDEPGRYEIDPIPIKVEGPRDLLRAFGIDESYFNQFIDGYPVGEGETETLLRVMCRLRDFRMTDLVRWTKPELNLTEALEDPAAYRGQLFQLSGFVTKVEACHLKPEAAERFGFDTYYRCDFEMDNDQPAIIFTRKIPKQWKEEDPADAHAGAFGMLLKFASEDEEQPIPVFLAPRIAWYPNTVLGDLGMDVGLLGTLRNRTGLGGHDREAFYQMLAAVGRAKPRQLIRDATEQLKTTNPEFVRTDQDGNRHYSVVPLFNQSNTQRGRLVLLSGVARRTLEVRVSDEDIVERFGIDHYYELYIYPEDSQDNPVVFCVRDLPKGMPTGDGSEYFEYVEVAGFFFKTWAYAPRSGSRQLAPLLIGREPIWRKETFIPNRLIGAIAGGLFVVTLIGVWFALWSFGRGDKAFHKRALAKRFAPAGNVSLNDIGFQDNGIPDFSNLEQMEREAAELRNKEAEAKGSP